MASEVGEVLGVVPVTAVGGGSADLAPRGHPSSPAPAPSASAGGAPSDVVELSSQAVVASRVRLVGQAPQPQLQLSPEHLRAMVSGGTTPGT